MSGAPTFACGLALALLAGGARASVATGAEAPAAARQSIELVYRPPLRTKSTKTFTYEHALALIQSERSDDGVVETMQQQLEILSKETLQLQDEVRALADGRPAELRRLYEAYDFKADLKFTLNGVDSPGVIEWTTPLVATSVLFTWVPEEQAYGRFYDTRDGIEEALVRLSEDADLRGLLPAGPVAVGDSWTIDLARLEGVFAPVGSLPIHYKRGNEDNLARAVATGLGGALSEMLYGGRQRTGSFVARLEAVDGEGESRAARISLALDVTCEGDQTGLVQNSLTNAERVAGSYAKSAHGRWMFEGRGELVWDLAGGRFDSLKLAGSEDVEKEIELASLLGPGKSRQKLRMKGGLKVDVQRQKLPSK
jgi:hypothetical protein